MQFTVETSGSGLSKQAHNPVTEEALPLTFALDQNYPNPFNPTTTIRYELADDALVTLKVYDVIGREVATLVGNEQQRAGVHNARFDGSSLSSGVYYYRWTAQTATAKEFTETQKLMLVK